VPRRRRPDSNFDPFRREADAFRVLIWFVAAVAAIVVVVLVVRALT
jgi:hypothetical protein